ncbi:MAG TPA: DUF4349 domain-containing protein [Solirubrobacteraceae bacterium]|nr:DUF4349 domain-containing protein [Solirubrobacteraceae bacterium]
MRIIPFPSEQPLPGEDAWIAELEAALSGEQQGPSADAWRELREDVRSLAPSMDPAFRARLERELLRREVVPSRQARPALARRALADRLRTVARRLILRPRPSPSSLAGHLHAVVRRPLAHRRLAILAGALAAAVALAAALVIATPRESRAPAQLSAPAGRLPRAPQAQASPSIAPTPRASKAGPAQAAASGAASPTSSTGAASAPGRVQQLAASMTLGTSVSEVQAVSDEVAQLTVREGGYVQSSNVRVQQQGTSEGTLSLRLPSAKLSAALAAIGRLAPVRAENQSLEDITGAYEAAHRQLADALAERSALLRALAAATTEGQIDSLRERLAQARRAISRAQASVNAVSQKASTAEVEVSVLGNTHGASTGLTLHTGLHDAGRVLLVTLIVLLIACAVLVPLALVIAAVLSGRSAWRRYQRERALGAS